MDKEHFALAAKIFIAGFCALFLGVAGRYYSTHGLETAGTDSSFKQVASVGLRAADLSDTSDTEKQNISEAADQSTDQTTDQTTEEPSTEATPADPNPSDQAQPTTASENPAPTTAAAPAPAVVEETGLPILTVTGLIIDPLPMNKNNSVRITATVRNTGTRTATNVSGALKNTTNGYALGTHAGYSFAPGQQYDFWEQNSYPYFATCDNGGVNVLRFTIDPANLIQESNESDNYFEVSSALAGC
jgi:hypothetical protein